AERARQAGRGADRLAQLQPVPPRVGDAGEAGRDAKARQRGVAVKVSGERTFDAPVATVWSVLNDPAQMAKTMPGVESFDVQDEKHWRAHVKVPLGLGGLRMSIDFEKMEEREPEFAKLHAKGDGSRSAAPGSAGRTGAGRPRRRGGRGSRRDGSPCPELSRERSLPRRGAARRRRCRSPWGRRRAEIDEGGRAGGAGARADAA